jgi:hypothetical protein
MRSSVEYAPRSILKTSVQNGAQRHKAAKEKICRFSPDLIESANSIDKGQNGSADEKYLRVESKWLHRRDVSVGRAKDSAQNVRVESHELCSVLVNTGSQVGITELELENPPKDVEGLTALPGLSLKKFMKELRAGKITQFCMLTIDGESESLAAMTAATTSSMDIDVLDDKTKIERYQSQSWESLKTNPFYKDILEFKDIFPEELPCELPKDKGIKHEIDLVPGTKYCVTRQWPLPREQVEAIDSVLCRTLQSWPCEREQVSSLLTHLLCQESHRRLEDCACIQ